MSKLLNQYVKDCIRTESKLDNLKLNQEVTKELLAMFSDLAELLDGLKKSLFYGKDTKLENFYAKKLLSIKNRAYTLSKINISDALVKTETDLNSRLFHGILGILTESGELAEILLMHMDGKDTDKIHIQEELGDHHWYHSIINDELQINPEETLTKNIKKLKARFPEKYSDELAENRNLEVERKVLEE